MPYNEAYTKFEWYEEKYHISLTKTRQRYKIPPIVLSMTVFFWYQCKFIFSTSLFQLKVYFWRLGPLHLGLDLLPLKNCRWNRFYAEGSGKAGGLGRGTHGKYRTAPPQFCFSPLAESSSYYSCIPTYLSTALLLSRNYLHFMCPCSFPSWIQIPPCAALSGAMRNLSVVWGLFC